MSGVTMKRIYLLLALPFAIAACGGSSIDEMRAGLPTSDAVQLKVPGSSGQALEGIGQQQQAVQGQQSFFYGVTRVVTVVVNVGTGLVLGLVKAITDNPPTSYDGHVAIWGPHTDPLSPTTWRFTATDNGHHQYSYSLEGKAKQDPDSAYKVVLSGVHVAAVDSHGHPIRGFGSGNFLIDWDQARTLPQSDPNAMGTGAFSYSRLSASAPVEIDVTFTQVYDAVAQQRVNANYSYVQAPGADGMFQFSTYRRVNTSVERLAIESRWKSTGAGRSDVIVAPGAPPATINECWDQYFISQFQRVSYDPLQNYGNEATDCAFMPAEYPSL